MNTSYILTLIINDYLVYVILINNQMNYSSHFLFHVRVEKKLIQA